MIALPPNGYSPSIQMDLCTSLFLGGRGQSQQRASTATDTCGLLHDARANPILATPLIEDAPCCHT